MQIGLKELITKSQYLQGLQLEIPLACIVRVHQWQNAKEEEEGEQAGGLEVVQV